MNPEEGALYGGISDVLVPSAPFDLGQGITFFPAQAHLMRPYLMTARRPDSSFPAFMNARESFGFDIIAEICVPEKFDNPLSFDKANIIWWIAALLRIRTTPRIRVPVLSDRSFSSVLRDSSTSFRPVQTEADQSRMILEPSPVNAVAVEDLEWVRAHWIDAGNLMDISREFNLAFQAFDQSSFARDQTLALLLLWSALESLFSPGHTELRFRVSTNIATFLESPGEGRADLQREVARLYDFRSAATHGRREEAEGPLKDSYAILKRILVKIIEQNRVPKIADIEADLFAGR